MRLNCLSVFLFLPFCNPHFIVSLERERERERERESEQERERERERESRRERERESERAQQGTLPPTSSS